MLSFLVVSNKAAAMALFHRASGEQPFRLSSTQRNRPEAVAAFPWPSTFSPGALLLSTLTFCQSNSRIRIPLPLFLRYSLSYLTSSSGII